MVKIEHDVVEGYLDKRPDAGFDMVQACSRMIETFRCSFDSVSIMLSNSPPVDFDILKIAPFTFFSTCWYTIDTHIVFDPLRF